MDCLKVAVQEAENLINGKVFLVRDLFKGYERNRLETGERRSLGALFLYEVKYGKLKGHIKVSSKSIANQ